MNYNVEKWYALLVYWQDTQLRHALTFSYIIGALRNPIGSKSDISGKDEVRTIISQITKHRCNNCFLHIYRCPDIDQMVITRVRNSIPPVGATLITKNDHDSCLYVSDIKINTEDDPFEFLVEKIWAESKDAIDDCKFSRSRNSYNEFSEYDMKIINGAFG